MTADQITEADDESEGVAVVNNDTSLPVRSDFWVGLLVLAASSYGLVAVARLLFF